MPQIDMVEIKDVYSTLHQRSLVDDIHTYCTEDDARSILLSLIKGTDSFFTFVEPGSLCIAILFLFVQYFMNMFFVSFFRVEFRRRGKIMQSYNLYG